MVDVVDKACGIDVHKDMLVVTLLSGDNGRCQKTMGVGEEELLSLRAWLLEENCERVALESTGIYWKKLNRVLSNDLDVWVLNPRRVKKPPGKKTDRVDSEWLATLCRTGVMEGRSRVFNGKQEELRDLTRYRESLVKTVHQFKNRAHKLLESCSVKLGSVLSDIFGTTGRTDPLKVFSPVMIIEVILKRIRSRKVKRKEEEYQTGFKVFSG